MFGKKNKRKEPIVKSDTLNEEEIYRQVTANYLKLSGAEVVSLLGTFCERRNGMLTYDEMEKVLGKHYPKASWVDKNDKKECIKTFLEYSDFIFYKADETYVYFP